MPADHSLKIDAFVADLRQRAASSGMTKVELARKAMLHANTLRDFDHDGWNPSLTTLRKLETSLETLPEGAPPTGTRRSPRRKSST